MKRTCPSSNDDPKGPNKKQNHGSFIPGTTEISRDVEVAKSYFDFPREIHWRIFSNCSENNYKSLLNFSCVSQDWNKRIQEYILFWRMFEKQSFDNYAALCGNPKNLEDDLSLAPRDLYINKLAQIQIYTCNGTGIFEILSSELEAFNKKEVNKEGISNVDIFYEQFRLIKITEYYLFSDQLFFDVNNEDEEELDFESIFKFLASFESSNIVKGLMIRLVQYINDMFTKNTDSQGILIWLMYNLVRKKLVDFNQIKPFILHITSLPDSAYDELSSEIMNLLDMCIIALFKEVVPFLNKEKTYKNSLIERLLTQIIRGDNRAKSSAFELLRNMQQYHCLQSEQQAIIIKYLDTKNWKIDILLLVRLGDDATLLKALHAKISFQFVNNIYEGLVKVDLDSKTIHDDFFISSGLLTHTMRFLEHTFQLLLQDRSINENVRNELKRVVELLRKIENRLNENPTYAMEELNSEVDNSEESGSGVSNSEVDNSEESSTSEESDSGVSNSEDTDSEVDN